MKNNNKFDISSFISPGGSYSPVYVWVWNDVCTQELIDSQLAEMQKLGIRAFYILPEPKNFRPGNMPTSLTPDYLSPEYFELCAYAIKKGKSLGMNCWIYDEGGWPSGGACGKVLQNHPEYARQVLKFYEKTFSAGEVYKKTSPDILAAFFEDNNIIEEGCKFAENTVITEYVTQKVISSDADYPDLLNKNATKYFIEITHEKYASAMKNTFSKNVSAVFTDEPKAPSRAFNKELSEKYEDIYGESILPYLPLIAQKVKPTEENVHILHRWYDLCSRMFCENFLLPCKKWANDHGIAFTGHLDMDHNPLGCIRGGGNFNIMRALRCFDIPGIDVIRRQIYPETKIASTDDFNGYNGFFPRYASSAAAQNGTKLAMSEIFGVGGAAMTYDIMRYTVGYQAVRGINIFNPFNFPLGRKGEYLAQELPVFTQKQVYHRYLCQFNRYVERLSYIASLGERVCETGLYYPVHDFQGGLKAEVMSQKFDALGRALEDMTVDFDIVDDDVLQAATGLDNGCFCIGNAVYRHIIIPEGAFVPEESQKALNRFIKGGGRVSHSLSSLTPTIQVEGEGLRAMHRKAENAELYCLFREKGESEEYKIHLPSTKGYLLDLTTGSLQRADTENGILKLSLQMGETAVILLTDEPLEAENKQNFGKSFDISENFVFSKEVELICNENGFENIKHADKSVSADLGDWASLIGSDYCGSGVYKTTFTLPTEEIGKEGELDLGDVRFAAQVFLNGQALGTALMPAYRFKIPADILQKENELKIVVTNTSANWYVHTDYFDKWKTEELSPYFEDELNYAKDFVSGGLYGPVTLYT
ncbi:MAG: beta galactosidase jelly roll domain-containing protein [Clostridia bacterium]|nr:beta galactosidase jelly roll domain-containing protein [Clostridia bacterium]